LIGLFFITNGARIQGVVMVVVLVITVLFQFQLQGMFDPLITYLPIDVQEELESKVHEQKLDEGRNPDEEEDFKAQRESKQPTSSSPNAPQSDSPESSKPSPRGVEFKEPDSPPGPDSEEPPKATLNPLSRFVSPLKGGLKDLNEKIHIPGLNKHKIDEDDEEDLNIDTALVRKHTRELSRDELTALAFQHEALRARPPILWIPDDELGIARDEIRHTKLECGNEVEMTCEGSTLDSKGKIIWSQNPPDYVYIPTL